jgi:hypothetical protein
MKWREWLLSLAPEYFYLVRTARKLDVNYWQITVETYICSACSCVLTIEIRSSHQ